MFRVTKKKPRKATIRTSSTRKNDDGDEDDVNLDTANAKDDNDDDDNDGGRTKNVVVKRKKKSKQQRGLTIRSFNDDEDEEGEDDNENNNGSKSSRKRRKKKRKGLGFGGGATTGGGGGGGWGQTTADDDDNDNSHKDPPLGGQHQNHRQRVSHDSNEEFEKPEMPSYNLEELKKLRDEQKKKKAQPQHRKTDDTTMTSSDTQAANTPTTTKKARVSVESNLAGSTTTSKVAEDPSIDHGTILTGEKALDFIKLSNNASDKNDDDGQNETTERHKGYQKYNLNIMDIEDDGHYEEDDQKESQDWEDQIASRAGVQISKGNTTNSTMKTTTTTRTNQVAAPSNLPSLETLCKQFQSTATHLMDQQSDMDNAIMRREADLAQLESTCKRQKKSLEEVGLACNYYQQMRNSMALWVGALRDLQQKVDRIFESLVELVTLQYQMNQKEWLDWQDDAATVLQKANLLPNIVGRRPKSFSQKDLPPAVDEFGRDIQSQMNREIEKRYRNRTTRHAFDDDEDNDTGNTRDDGETYDPILFATWMEDGDFYNRYKILMEALRVALNDLDDTYTEISELVNIFADWKKEYPEDYIQCYANLSLGDLSSILIKVDFCRSSWIESMLNKDDGSKEGDNSRVLSWMTHMLSIEDVDKPEGEEGAVDRVLSKVYVPFILSLLKEAPNFYFLSVKKSGLMASFVTELITNLSSGSAVRGKILDALVDSISRTLESVCILLVDGKNLDVVEEQGTYVVEALDFARRRQGVWVQVMVLNLIKSWVPLFLGTEHYMKIGDYILSFVSGKFLFLLSSLDKAMASSLLMPVWKRLRSGHGDWLDSPAMMLQSAPLRAAAAAYELS